MTHAVGFDNAHYLQEQKKAILDRMNRFPNKLYLEFGGKLSEVLTCLAINAATNPMAHLALERMGELQGCEVHITHIPTPGDDSGLRRFGINLTTDPNFASKHLLAT